ncbi:MAG TPA: hypothetical protein VES20_15520 [Bryobacteraceae bacterium]|nr:hypothetical protein [Bryobacteraceae bacterium]
MLALALLLASFPSSLDQYAGRYVLIGVESADVKGVIEDTVRQFNFLIRPIARSRLQKTNVAFPSIEFRRTADGSFTIWHEQGTAVTHAAPGQTVRAVSPDNSRIEVSLVPGPPLREIYQSGEGRRENRYELSAGGESLAVHVNIASPRLRGPIVYRLVYRRAPLQGEGRYRQ